MYLSRQNLSPSNADNPGEMNQNRDVFESAMKTAECDLQTWIRLRISLTDVSHYSISDPTKT